MPPSSTPRLSFRNVPPAIYLALGIGLAGALTFAVSGFLSTGELWERYQANERWRMLETACDAAGTVLLALGLLELARRHVGSRRVLARASAGLGLAGLGWLTAQPVIAIAEPGVEAWTTIYTWLGRGTGVLMLAGAVLLTLAADAWRRVPAAAAALVAISMTGYWIPVLGEEIAALLGTDFASRQLYGLIRLSVYSGATLLVAAALAAGGRDPAPDPHAAAGGLRLARGALIFRIVAAIAIALLVITAQSSRDGVKVIALAGPSVVVIAMAVLAVGLQRVAGARLDGMPQVLLSVGAALTLTWAALQFEQATILLNALTDRFGASRAFEAVQWFSIAGPVAATLGLALVGTAIASYAGHRGDLELRRDATGRTATFVTLTLASVAIPFLAKPTSPGGAVAVLLFAALTSILGLLALAALLARAAESLESDPGIPHARVV